MNYATSTLKELKAYAQENNVYVTGDKRTKQAYIDSIEHHLLHTSDVETSQPETSKVETVVEAIATTEPVTVETAIATMAFTQSEPFTVELPEPEPEPEPTTAPASAKLSSVVALQPLAFMLAAVVLGVVSVAIGIAVASVRIVRWTIPRVRETLAPLQKYTFRRDRQKSILLNT